MLDSRIKKKISDKTKKRAKIIALAIISGGLAALTGVAIHKKIKSYKEQKLIDDLNEYIEQEIQMESMDQTEDKNIKKVPFGHFLPSSIKKVPSSEPPKTVRKERGPKDILKAKQDRKIMFDLEQEILGRQSSTQKTNESSRSSRSSSQAIDIESLSREAGKIRKHNEMLEKLRLKKIRSEQRDLDDKKFLSENSRGFKIFNKK
jgi:hypothetical protein